MADDFFIWNTKLLQVYRDCSGDIVIHERPTCSNDFIFVNPEELLAFCKHYVSLAENKGVVKEGKRDQCSSEVMRPDELFIENRKIATGEIDFE